jgi:hypothetical protein
MALDKRMIDDEGFLWFEDITEKEISEDDFITVEMYEDELKKINELRSKSQSIHSYLVQNNLKQIKIVNNKESWISWRRDIMHVSKINSEEYEESKQQYFRADGINIEQFIWHKDSDENYTIHPDFVKAYQLVEDKENNTFKKDRIIVIKFSTPSKIEIKTEYMRDFLFQKNMCLIINYNCKRRIKKHYLETIGKKRKDKKISPIEDIQPTDKCFYIHAGEDEIYWKNKDMTDSELKGHFVVFPRRLRVDF